MNRKHLIYGLLALLILGGGWAGLSYWRWRVRMAEWSKPDIPRRVFRTQQTLDGFLAASEATVERLHYRSNPGKNPWQLDNYDRDAPLALNADQTRLIQQALTQESAYGWKYAKLCAPDYGVLYTFRSEGATVRIAVCFKCYLLGVFDSTDDAAQRINDEEDFNGGANRVLAGVAKELFPNDVDIQNLK